METVKSANGKTICRADGKSKTVEIVHKGVKTIIKITTNGKYHKAIEVKATKQYSNSTAKTLTAVKINVPHKKPIKIFYA